MNKIILFILFLITTMQFVFSQGVSELGMSENELLSFNQNICLIDTLDDGTKFIKGMLADNKNHIYYFLNDSDSCFCVVLYFDNIQDINKFIDTLALEYTRRNNIWINENITIKLKSIDDDLPLFFIWSKDIKLPEDWNYHK